LLKGEPKLNENLRITESPPSTMKKLLLATTNAHKAHELASLLGDVPFVLTTPQEEGLSLEVEETGTTFEENAALKALAFAKASGLLSLADDSGIEIAALGGAPGIYSSRYAGPDVTDEGRVQFLLDKIKDVPDGKRQGRFRCVVAIAGPEGDVSFFQGTVEGVITFEPTGENGFGYDPIFFLPDRGCTTAQLAPEEKNRISHRGQAARAASKALRQMATEATS
jgi:XTP/dITP diphosphohydrolase